MARITNADQLMLGDEPQGSSVIAEYPNYRESLIKALNWYAYDHGQEHAKKFTIEFMKKAGIDKTKIKKVEATKESRFIPTHGFIFRLVTRGAVIDPQTLATVGKYLTDLVEDLEEKKEVQKTESNRPSIKDVMNEKIQEYLGEVEGYLDDALVGKSYVDLYSEMKANHFPQQYGKPIAEFLSNKLPELKEALAGNDEQLTEAYSYLTTAKLKKYIKYIEDNIEGVEKYIAFKKSNRKAPVRKAKPPSVQVAKLNYKREDTTFNLNSILATDIIGATQLWVFNTKTKKLGVYKASGSSGLGVKGSSIINYEPETSTQKTLRKPDEVLKKCIDGGKLVLRKLLGGVNTKETPLNGRINNETVLVRVEK